MFNNRLSSNQNSMEKLDNRSPSNLQDPSHPISLPRRPTVATFQTTTDRNDSLVGEIFESSGPGRPHLDGRRQSWMPDASAESCTKCHRLFTLFLRRHHCRRCGWIFCAGCSNNRITHLRGPEDKDCYRLWYELVVKDGRINHLATTVSMG